MSLIEEIKQEIANISVDQVRNHLWSEHLSNLSLDKNIKAELTEIEVGFYSLFFKKYQEIIVPLIYEKVIPYFEDWYEEEVEVSFDEIKLQAFTLVNLEEGRWEVFFEDDQEDFCVCLVMKDWTLEYTTGVG